MADLGARVTPDLRSPLPPRRYPPPREVQAEKKGGPVNGYYRDPWWRDPYARKYSERFQPDGTGKLGQVRWSEYQ